MAKEVKGNNSDGLILEIKAMVLELCKDKAWDWRPHIEGVVKYSKLLAEKLGADKEICEISAWLHDITKLKESRQAEHHITGSEEAARILQEYKYPPDRIERIKHCILTHSSRDGYFPDSKEAKIVASADALSLLDNFLNLAQFVYGIKKYSVEKGRQELIKRYKSYVHKLEWIPEAKEIGKAKLDAIELILGINHIK